MHFIDREMLLQNYNQFLWMYSCFIMQFISFSKEKSIGLSEKLNFLIIRIQEEMIKLTNSH